MVPPNVRKINEPPNVIKVQSRDVSNAKCKDDIIKCEKK